MSGPGPTTDVYMAGYITRANLSPPQGPLDIFIDPYWPLLGDDADAADTSMHAGVTPAISALKTVWADSPYVAGKQLVLATPDNSTLDLRLIIDGDSMADMQAKIAPIVEAIRNQLSFQVSVTFDDAIYTWQCWTGDYEVAMNQLWMFGYLCPLYLTLPRSPIPIAGPI
jgi:hypothetical protein